MYKTNRMLNGNIFRSEVCSIGLSTASHSVRWNENYGLCQNRSVIMKDVQQPLCAKRLWPAQRYPKRDLTKFVARIYHKLPQDGALDIYHVTAIH